MSDNKDNKGENINPDENITKKSDRCCFEGEEEYEKWREQYIKSLTGEHYDIKDYYVGDNKCVVINRNLSEIILAIVSFFRRSGVALAIVGLICSIAGICISVNTMSSGLGALLTLALLL